MLSSSNAIVKQHREIIANQRRREILDNSARLFVLKGYDRTTVDKVAQDCGISKGLLYNYFRSKEDILNTIAQHMLDSHTDVLRRIEGLNQQPYHRDYISDIMSVIDWLCQHQSHLPRYTMVMHDERNRIDRDMQRQFIELGIRCTAAIEKLVVDGIEAGKFNTKNPRLAAVTIIFTAQEWVYRWILLRTHYTFEEFLQFHKENMLKTLGVSNSIILAGLRNARPTIHTPSPVSVPSAR